MELSALSRGACGLPTIPGVTGNDRRGRKLPFGCRCLLSFLVYILNQSWETTLSRAMRGTTKKVLSTGEKDSV